MDKNEIRENIRKEIECFRKRKAEEERVIRKIRDLEEYRDAKTVLVYSPLDDEIDISPLFSDSGKTFLFPYVERDEMFFSTPPLSKGLFGIQEPIEKEEYNYQRALIITPGRAFTLGGARLGRGKGFYDRYIRKNREKLFSVGVCYSIQIFPTLPQSAEDQSLDLIISGGV